MNTMFILVNFCRVGILALFLFLSPLVNADVQFDSSTDSIDEGWGAYTFTVTRSVAGPAASVNYTISGTATPGSDFTGATSGTLNWGVSDGADKTFVVNIADDQLVESAETIVVTLSNEIGEVLGANTTKTVTILDNEDILQFSSASYAVNESTGSVLITVDRPMGTSAAVSVDYSTISGTATAGSDFTASSGTVSWGSEDTAPSKSFSIAITNDAISEDNEVFTVVLSNPSNGSFLGTPSSAVVTINSQTAVVSESDGTADDQSNNIAEIPNLSNNQKGTAGVIDSECSFLGESIPSNSDEEDFKRLCDNLRDSNTSDDQVKQALDAINPEELTKMGAVSRQVGGLQHQNIESRFNIIHRGGGGGIDLSGLNLNLDGQQIQGAALKSMLEGYLGGAASGDEFSRWGLFANGNLKFGDKDAGATSAGYDFDMFGLTVGADYRFTDDFVLGASVGYGVADIDYSNDAGGMDTASWSGSLYSSYYVSQNWYVDGLINYAQDSYDSRRRIFYTDAGGSVDRVASGDTDGKQLSFGVNSGYDFHAGAWLFGPHFSSYYLNVDIDGLEERGAGAWNTVLSSNQSQSFTVSGGGHVSYTFTPSWGVIVPYARVDLVHEFYDDPEVLQMRFAVSSEMIEISTDRLESDYVNIGVGVTAQFKHGLSGFVGYQTTAGYSGLSIHDISAGMRLERTF